MSKKKSEQLGMNPGTANYQLTRSILFDLVCQLGKDTCYHCEEKILKDEFSIEHKVPWLDSDNPIDMFFDLDNISFSHLRCNRAAARSAKKIDPELRKERKLIRDREYRARTYTKERRQAQYLRTGK